MQITKKDNNIENKKKKKASFCAGPAVRGRSSEERGNQVHMWGFA
jgi:hypothetical protein